MNTGSKSLGSSSVFIQVQSIRVPVWDSQSVNALWSALAAGSGLNLSPDEVRHFSLLFPEQMGASPGSTGRVRHILLIEDNPADVGLVREALNEHGVGGELTVIANGERAIKFIDETEAGEQQCPDLIILDLNLPKRSGKDVLTRIRTSTICPQVPVIILTSSDNQRDKDD